MRPTLLMGLDLAEAKICQTIHPVLPCPWLWVCNAGRTGHFVPIVSQPRAGGLPFNVKIAPNRLALLHSSTPRDWCTGCVEAGAALEGGAAAIGSWSVNSQPYSPGPAPGPGPLAPQKPNTAQIRALMYCHVMAERSPSQSGSASGQLLLG